MWKAAVLPLALAAGLAAQDRPDFRASVDLITTDMIARRWPATVCRLGATLFITAQLIQLGGYRQLYEATSRTGRDLDADFVALQLVDAIDDALELGAFTLLAVGMLGFGATANAARAARTWSHTCTATGLVYLALAGTMALAAWTAVDLLLITGGTLAAAIRLLRKVGAEVAAAACIIELGFLKGRDRLDVPFNALISYES